MLLKLFTVIDFLIADTLADHPWREVLERPQSEFTLALSCKEVFIKERDLAGAKDKSFLDAIWDDLGYSRT
jgi:hypothetical protein